MVRHCKMPQGAPTRLCILHWCSNAFSEKHGAKTGVCTSTGGFYKPILHNLHSMRKDELSGTPFAMLSYMRIAIPLWQGRVSPVFDESGRILLVDICEKQEHHRQEESLATRNPFERAQALLKLGADLLICGMISQTQQTALAAAGLRVIPHICGSMEDVIAAFLDGRIENGALLMPGCRGRKRMHHRMAGLVQKEA